MHRAYVQRDPTRTVPARFAFLAGIDKPLADCDTADTAESVKRALQAECVFCEGGKAGEDDCGRVGVDPCRRVLLFVSRIS